MTLGWEKKEECIDGACRRRQKHLETMLTFEEGRRKRVRKKTRVAKGQKIRKNPASASARANQKI